MATSINHLEYEYSDVIPADRVGLLSASELAKLLNISPKTVYAYVSKGLIPVIKIESNVRFSPQEIRQWLQGKSVPGPMNRDTQRRRPSNA